MAPNVPTLKLNTGATIPSIALGTWESAPGDAYKAVSHALKVGYRHIDTAQIYGNEEDVGRAINDSDVPRKEIFLTTKVFPHQFHDIPGALDASLKRLGQDYIDLYLIHWPFATDAKGEKFDPSVTFIDAYAELQKLPKEKVKAIGVSNFDVQNLHALLADARTKTIPATNQVELHVNLVQQPLVDFAREKGIVVEAYSPLSRGEALKNPVLEKIAKAHNTTTAAVSLSWNIDRGVVVLPKSVTPARIEENLSSYVKLSEDEVKEISGIQAATGLRRHCNYGQKFDFDTFHGDADAK